MARVSNPCAGDNINIINTTRAPKHRQQLALQYAPLANVNAALVKHTAALGEVWEARTNVRT